MIKRKSMAVWTGGVKDGTGKMTTASGVLRDAPYSFSSRFESGTGTNPDELVAAAHAGCFAMAFSLMLTEAGFKPEELRATAEVQLEKQGAGFSVTASHLTVVGKVPGISMEQFLQMADRAKEGCPISRLLNARITLEGCLEQAHAA